ncbi:hypothetical protein MIZ03_1489 [Rhodoferax lithotrophicus]|uniref:Uncharacterized protein n=1 Tax=Rhodoferax lithotrophicus TaxID=2798804 RepID=A0ABM7MJY0_9BURK|nr:hypothetical protein MIZ03_1489 [Rhodoferax sp. MIZ03]
MNADDAGPSGGEASMPRKSAHSYGIRAGRKNEFEVLQAISWHWVPL